MTPFLWCGRWFKKVKALMWNQGSKFSHFTVADLLWGRAAHNDVESIVLWLVFPYKSIVFIGLTA